MMQLSGVVALVVAVAFMLVVFGQIPINDVLVGRMHRSEWRSRVYAFRYIVTFSVSRDRGAADRLDSRQLGILGAVRRHGGRRHLDLAAVLLLPRTAVVTGEAPAAAE